MKFVYGPVPSRRLGQSLGIDLLPFKTCNYQCIYCQLGRTTHFTNFRRDFFSKKDIIGEMESTITLNEERTDYITFVGSGEPTLYKNLKALINFAKNISNKPVCVITNGSLLYNQEVQEALLLADVVLPSFDAGDKKKFIKINRPHPSLDFNDILQGFINFRNRYVGKFWIEIMIMKGINDDHTNLQKIKKEIDLINPDRIDVNVPIRPPTESWVKIPDMEVFNIIEEIFGDYYDMNYPEYGEFNLYSTNFKKELLALIKRHPMRQNQIIETFSTPCFKEEDIIKNLKSLESQYKIKNIIYNDNIFWQLYV